MLPPCLLAAQSRVSIDVHYGKHLAIHGNLAFGFIPPMPPSSPSAHLPSGDFMPVLYIIPVL